jgi:hypothetical protein
MKAREVVLIVLLSPLLLAVGLHVGFAAYYLRQFLRLPYVLGVILLLSAEMAAVAFAIQVSWGLSAGIFGAVLLLTVVWHVLFCSRSSLVEGCNLEYLAPWHLLFLNAAILLPMLAGVAGQP